MALTMIAAMAANRPASTALTGQLASPDQARHTAQPTAVKNQSTVSVNPVALEEYGYAAPDPLDPNIIYGGKITRFDQRSREVQNISPEAVRSGKYRFLRTAPVIFSDSTHSCTRFSALRLAEISPWQ